jgi:cell division protein ZapA
MPIVDVSVNGRTYDLTCDAGQEEHLRGLADHVDKKVTALMESVGQIGDARLMLMAALLATEENLAAEQRLAAQAQALVDLTRSNDELKRSLAEADARAAEADARAAEAVNRAAKRAGAVAARLAAH